jgi:3-methyladenine DNA glycosylase/8-oxoguanine DNA glycosylase
MDTSSASRPDVRHDPKFNEVSLEPVLHSHGWINLAPAELVDRGFRYSLEVVGGCSATVTVIQKDKVFQVQSDRTLSPRRNHSLTLILNHMLSLDFPLDEFVCLCRARNERVLLKLAKCGWGRMFRSPTYWEDAVKTLCTTNASWGYTQQMCQRLCNELGVPTPSGLKTFPSPSSVLDAGEAFLKGKVGIGYRSKSLLLLAQRALSGNVPWLLDPSLLVRSSDAETEITSWHGFGKYATRHLLVLMGFHDYLPVDREVGLHLGVRKAGEQTKDLDANHFEDWGKFRFTAYKLSRIARRQNWIGD